MSEQFVKHREIAEGKFGDKYDYSNFEYTTRKAKSLIGCPLHGEFEATIYEHGKSKYGCPNCAKLLNPTYYKPDNFTSGLPDFVRKIYDFSVFDGDKIDTISVIRAMCDGVVVEHNMSARQFIESFRRNMIDMEEFQSAREPAGAREVSEVLCPAESKTEKEDGGERFVDGADGLRTRAKMVLKNAQTSHNLSEEGVPASRASRVVNNAAEILNSEMPISPSQTDSFVMINVKGESARLNIGPVVSFLEVVFDALANASRALRKYYIWK